MRFSKFLFLLFVLILGSASSVKAKPFWGGDISYEYIGQDSFYVTITKVEECSWQWPGGSFVQLNISNNCGNSLNKWIYRASEKSVSPYCASNTNVPTCSGAIAGGFYEVTYEGLIVLTGSGCTDWTVSADIYSRPTTVVNMDASGWGGQIMLYTKIYRSLAVNNSSPKSNIPAFMYAVQNQPSQLSVQTQDEDSLTYELSRPLRVNGIQVTYTSGYSYTNPLGSNNLTIDQNTGLIEFTPDSVGDFVVGVTIKEWDRNTGALKSFYVQEKYITVLSGTQYSPVFDTAGFSNLGDGTLTNRVLETCPGDSVHLTIQVSDSNITDQLTLTHDIYEVLGTSAIVTVTGNNPMMVDLKWVANTEKVGDLTFQIIASDNGCPIILKSYELFTIQNKSGVFAGVDQFLCAGDTVSLNATGGSGYVWSSLGSLAMDTVSSSNGYNATCTNCAVTTVFPGATSMYQVSSTSGSVCGSFDTVNVSMSPTFTITPPSDTITCMGNAVSLPVIASLNNANTQFSWSPLDGLNNTVISSPTALVQNPTQYSIAVTNGSCTKQGFVQVGVFLNLPVAQIMGDTLVCTGDTIPLTVQRINFPSGCGSYNNNPLGPTQSGIIGTDTLISTQSSYFFCPYNRAGWGSKNQYLFTPSELLGMGLKPGANISSLAFDVTQAGIPNNLNNLEIEMGCTSSSDLSLGWESGLQLVLPSYTHYVSTGWNVHSFTNFFMWDGTSNLVVSITKQDTNYNYQATSKLRFSNTVTTKSIYYIGRHLNVGADLLDFDSNIGRPNIKFEFNNPVVDSTAYNFTWPTNTNISSVTGDSTLVYPIVNSTYTGVLTHTISGCTDTVTKNITVRSTLFDARFTADSSFCVNDSAQVFLPNYPGGIFTGVGVDSAGVFDPSVAGAGQWPINYNIPAAASCTNDSTQTITVIGLPDATIETMEVCAGLGGVSLEPTTPGGTWFGPQILNSTTGLFIRQGLLAGSVSNVIYNLTTPCAASDTVDILIVAPFQFSLLSDTVSLCQGDTLDVGTQINFNSGATQGQFPVYEYVDTAGIISPLGIVNTQGFAPGNYNMVISITDSLGNCGESKSFMIIVNEVEHVEWMAAPDYCSSQMQATLSLSPGLFTNGVSYQQRALSPLGANDTLNITAIGNDGEFNPQLVGIGGWEIEIALQNQVGCIGKLKDTIRVSSSPIALVTNLGLELIATSGIGYSYQWLDCNNNMDPVIGATDSVFVPGQKGQYAVQISLGSCIDVSSCFETWPVGIENNELLGISLYPNPTSDILNIDKGSNTSLEITITNSAGAVVHQSNTQDQITSINMAQMATGIYVVTLKNELGVKVERVVKR
ncbi:MAG: hypothetical protein ACJA2N_001703 [Salibacteraceae bacterium]|jgi:hypothetical protein